MIESLCWIKVKHGLLKKMFIKKYRLYIYEIVFCLLYIWSQGERKESKKKNYLYPFST